MSNIDIIRWKRLINELSFLNEEIDLVDSIIYEYNKYFLEYYEIFCKKNNIDINKLNQENHEKINKLYCAEQPDNNKVIEIDVHHDNENLLSTFSNRPNKNNQTEYEMTQEELEMHESFVKLFRALALKLHPDKLSSSLTIEERNDMINMFNKSKEALDERKYFVLLDLASKFKIKSPKNYKQQIRWMKKELGIMKQQVKQKKTTYNYAFSECETNEQKDNLVRKFIKHLFDIKV
mgnify:CR=1 FL=1|tara:strand:- start:142 stop:846 length:705 start_codon:yes stop_codon:yes gene_type:complete